MNGDGYDDFLIGAYKDEEGGANAGQTYLIMGKAKGWSMDTDLSSSNASFIGEDQQDLSGFAVSGAGDVNRDGYDDFLIGAYGDEEGGTSAGQTYLILGKDSGWSMDTDLSEADASFLGVDDGDESGTSVAGGGDVNGDGYDDILIGAPRVDSSGSDAGRVYLLFYDDGEDPRLVLDSTPSVATTGDPFEFNVTVSDNRGIMNVSIEMWYGDIGYHYLVETNMVNWTELSEVWALNITVQSNSTEPIHYIVHVWDRAFNAIESGVRTVAVVDNDPPTLWDDGTPSNGTTGDALTFFTNATDNINLTDVRVVYWYGEDVNRTNVSMSHLGGDSWTHAIRVRSDFTGALHYQLHAEDNSSNSVTSETWDVDILDDDPPVFLDDMTPDRVGTEENLTFNASLEDNIGVIAAWVIYRYGDGPDTNLSLEALSGLSWAANLTVAATVDDLVYHFGVMDGSGNVNSTEERVVDVVDTLPPELISDASDTEATTGDPLSFAIKARDNVDVGEVLVHYAFGEGEQMSTALERLSPPGAAVVDLNVSIDVPSDFTGSMAYHFEVHDLDGNSFTSDTSEVTVVDNDAPTLVEDTTPGAVHLGDELSFSIKVIDNIGVEGVGVEFQIGDSVHETREMVPGQGDGAFDLTIPIPVNADAPLSYRFEASDLTGNALLSDWTEVTLVDGIPPVIVNVSWTDPVKGLEFTVTLEASDNVGILVANLSYWHGASRHVKAGMGEDLVVTITVPREIDGTLHFTVEVTDGAGNVATSEEMLVTPVNLPPEVDPVPAWQVVEGTESLLDLGPYVRDSNDDPSSLSVVLDDPNVSVEGLVLRGTFDVWVADLVLHLAITDGEDEVPLDLAVNIENVNDAPTILSVSPSNGSRIGEGRKITFTAEVLDEDGDDLVVTWMHGNGTIGSGSTLVYKKLPPGDQVVTVVVSDGVESVDAEVTLVILEDAGGQGVDPWVVLLLVAIAAIALALVWRIRFSK